MRKISWRKYGVFIFGCTYFTRLSKIVFFNNRAKSAHENTLKTCEDRAQLLKFCDEKFRLHKLQTCFTKKSPQSKSTHYDPYIRNDLRKLICINDNLQQINLEHSSPCISVHSPLSCENKICSLPFLAKAFFVFQKHRSLVSIKNQHETKTKRSASKHTVKALKKVLTDIIHVHSVKY